MPAVIFDRLPEDHVVQMFVTINAKHTRLNASHLVSLSGRQLYRDENLAAAHDVVRALSEREESPLHGEIKLLGVGHGRVAQAPLAQELKKLFATEAFGPGRKGDEFREDAKRFFVNYFRQVAVVFGAAWNGRKYSIKYGAGAARLHPRRAGHRQAARPAARGPRGLPRDRPRHRARGAAASATSASRPTAPGSGQGRRSISSPRSSASRCSTPKARWSRVIIRDHRHTSVTSVDASRTHRRCEAFS